MRCAAPGWRRNGSSKRRLGNRSRLERFGPRELTGGETGEAREFAPATQEKNIAHQDTRDQQKRVRQMQGRAITLLRRGGARWCSRPRSPRPRSPLKACASWSTADLRVPRYEPDLGLTRLETVRVSRAEDFAAQRRAAAAATTSDGMRRPMIICSRATDGSSASECQGNGQIRPSNAIGTPGMPGAGRTSNMGFYPVQKIPTLHASSGAIIRDTGK